MGSEREKSPCCLHVMLYDHSSVSNVCGLVKHELFGSSFVMERGCALVQDPGGRENYAVQLLMRPFHCYPGLLLHGGDSKRNQGLRPRNSFGRPGKTLVTSGLNQNLNLVASHRPCVKKIIAIFFPEPMDLANGRVKNESALCRETHKLACFNHSLY